MGSLSMGSVHVLLAAGEGDQKAAQLASSLRRRGARVELATTPADVHALAGKAHACVVVLRPGMGGDPLLRAVQSAGIVHIIPAFATPMVLPTGSWSAPPFILSNDATRVTGHVFASITPLSIPAAAPYSKTKPYRLAPPSPAPARRATIRASILTIIGIALLIAATITGLMLAR